MINVFRKIDYVFRYFNEILGPNHSYMKWTINGPFGTEHVKGVTFLQALQVLEHQKFINLLIYFLFQVRDVGLRGRGEHIYYRTFNRN